jgi:hypothetical protein
MATAWPATLPQCPTLDSWTEQRQRNIVAFQPEVGVAKMRRRSTAVGVTSTFTFRMTNAQVVTFNTFYETTLSDGTLPFDFEHPITNTNYSWIFDSKNAPTFRRLNSRLQYVSFTAIRLPT